MKTNLSYDQYIPTRILFGSGQLNNLHAQPMPGKRALIVISNGKSTRDNGYLARTEEQLHRAGVETEVFDGIMPNPTVANSAAGANAAREFKADFRIQALYIASLTLLQRGTYENFQKIILSDYIRCHFANIIIRTDKSSNCYNTAVQKQL